MKKLLVLAFAASLLLIACNNDKSKSAETSTPDASGGVPAKKLSNEVEITANDQMQYSITEINVKAGEKVTLTLRNIGTMPKQSMAHNFILLKDGTDLNAFAIEAQNAPDHIPANNPNIITHTKLLGPGESDTIEFTVPAGSYFYICSFPNHYKTMTGILTAE
jgi:azurin